MDQDQEYGSASAGQTPSQAPSQTLGWRRRLRAARHGARAALHRFHWSAEDILAVIVTAAIVLLIFLVLLRPS